jgi:dTDP-4-dehydrorhamnose reductase
MRVVLLGASGQVGSELLAALGRGAQVAAFGRSDLDLRDAAGLRTRLIDLRPDLVLNAAAYTTVDQAESERDLAFAVNATAPGVMAECMRELGGVLVHYSTDYVFDGTKAEAYVEDDLPAPRSVYGASKLAGEQAVAAAGAAHLILRTSWVYDLRGRNFLNTIRRLAAQRPELRIVDDQFGAPTWARWIARATLQVVDRCMQSPVSRDRLRSEWGGVYHLTAGGRTTWHGFAGEIVELLAGRGLLPRVPVVPIATAQYPLPAARPANSVLSNAKVREVFGVEQVDWRTQLRECLAEL